MLGYADRRNAYASWRNVISLLGVMITLLGVTVKRELACVDSHADDGVHVMRVEQIDFIPGRDAAGRGDPTGGCPTNRQESLDVSYMHQAFLVYMRIQNLAAERFERPDRVDGTNRQHRPPAMNRHMAAAAVDGGDH